MKRPITIILGLLLIISLFIMVPSMPSCPKTPTESNCIVDMTNLSVSCDNGNPAEVVENTSGLVLSLNMKSYTKLTVELTINNATSWVWDLGNSSGNNGACGDNGETNYDDEAWAQVSKNGGNLYLCDDDFGNETYSQINAFNPSSDKVTMIVSDGSFTFKSSLYPDGINWVSGFIFQIDGNEPDKDAYSKPNNDQMLWLGLNRVIYGADYNGRFGTGVTEATIHFGQLE